MKRIGAVSVIIMVFCMSLFADKNADIHTLLDLSGSGKIGIQMIDQMMQSFKTSFPSVPAAFWEEFRSEVKEDELVELIVPVYDKHFSHDEIKKLISFYKSPIGKKLVSKQSLIVSESYAIGQTWGQKLGAKVQKRLMEKGYK
jgi:uncharacterized protein